MPKSSVRRNSRNSINNKGRNNAGRLNQRGFKLPRMSREGALRFLVFAAFTGLLMVLVSPAVTLRPDWPTAFDDFAPRDYLSTVEFSTINLAQTEQARNTAAGAVPPVYTFDGEALRNALQRASDFLVNPFGRIGRMTTVSFEEKRQLLENDLSGLVSQGVIDDKIVGEVAETWLKSVIAEEEASAAPEQKTESVSEEDTTGVGATSAGERTTYRFNDLSQSVKTILKEVLEEGVIANDTLQQLMNERRGNAEVQLVNLRIAPSEKVVNTANLRNPDATKMAVMQRAAELYPDKKAGAAVGAVASQFITVTLTPDSAETENRRRVARENVAPVTKRVKPGQMIIRHGDLLTPQVRRELKDYRSALNNARRIEHRVMGSIGHGFVLALLMFGLAKCLAFITPSVYSSLRQVTLILLAITVMVGIAKLLSELNLDAQEGYLVPAAAVPILLAILMDKRVGLLTGAVLAVLVSMVYQNNWNVLAVVIAGSLAGVLGLVSVRRRSDLVRPGVLVTFVSIAMVIALGFISDTISWSTEGLTDARNAAINGALVMLIVPGTLSLFESAFKITTDIQLLELTDLNHPVLRRMTIEAPGTHHHSLMIGNLAEVAAEGIGANSLLARVCAYFHDIGKLNRPDYFAENQTDHNRHDGLSPVMSSRIIAAHVKDGVELAREHGLCQPVIDIIRQHHGTDLIRFFYEKALKVDKQDNGVRQEDFRYPGPKPQSREAAVVMVADCVESASRSLTNLTRDRLAVVADKIVNTRFADGQFDDCALTLKDLHVIADSIVRLLTSAHHRRIEYPEHEPPELVRRSRLPSAYQKR